MVKFFSHIAHALLSSRYLRFFVTGVLGVWINMLITWSLTEFVFGVDRYIIGYMTGTTVNLIFNFAIHTILTFGAKEYHVKRFVLFVLYSISMTGVQVAIVRTLTNTFGNEFYLPIIASVIFVLSTISYVFFRSILFKDNITTLKKWGADMLQAILYVVETFHTKIKNIGDTRAIIFIIILATLLRLPLLSYPQETQFDEVIYANFVVAGLEEKPYFDIHPPLARMIFTEIARTSDFQRETLRIDGVVPFEDFPYERIRFFIAIIGILLPLVLYAIARKMGAVPLIALIPALFVVLDKGFIVYSRVMLPDMLLLFFAFLSLFLILSPRETKKVTHTRWHILFAGIAIGCALSIKWTALGMAGVLGIILLSQRRIWGAISLAVLACLTYSTVFFVSFFYFPQGGKVDPIIKTYDTSAITRIEFPQTDNADKIAQSAISLHSAMLRANEDPDIVLKLPPSPHPASWSIARSSILFWFDETGEKRITMEGNALLWICVFFVFLFEIGWIFMRIMRERKWPASKMESILLLGYVANYLPFFFIGRPMYVYHYFTALIFLFLLVPFVLPRIIFCLNSLAGDRYFGYVFTLTTGLLIFINALTLLPTTYGF